MCGVYMAVNVKSPRQHGYVFVQISDDSKVRRDDKIFFSVSEEAVFDTKFQKYLCKTLPSCMTERLALLTVNTP